MQNNVTIRFFLVLALCLFLSGTNLLAQEDFLNPFEVDENTVLLMHFESDFTDASGNSDDALPEGKVLFVGSANSNLGNAVYIQNDSPSDTSQISIAHYEALNLSGSFTIEGWMLPVTYSSVVPTASNWNVRYPVILGKTSEGYWANKPWLIKIDQYGKRLYARTREDNSPSWTEGWHTAATAENTLQLNEWYHFVFVGDSANGTSGLMLHDADGNIIDIATTDFVAPTYGNEGPLEMGVEGWNQPGKYGRPNVILDEIRLSNVVRDYPFAPVISGVRTVYADRFGGNAYPGEDVEIEAVVRPIGSAELVEKKLYYRIGDSGTFTELELTVKNGDTLSAVIPGQTKGTTAQFYIAAETSLGARITAPTNAEDTNNPAYNGVGWWEDDNLMLAIDFEDGPGSTPTDTSFYSHPVIMHGQNFEYSTDVAPGAVGQYSLSINELDTEPDTSYLEIMQPTPYLNQGLHGWTVEFWFKAGEFPYSRHWFMYKGGFENFEVFAGPEYGDGFRTAGTGGSIQTWGAVEDPLNKWIQIRCGREDSTYIIMFNDENGQLLDLRKFDAAEAYATQIEQRSLSVGSLYFGRRGQTEITDMAHYKIDNIKAYNYPLFTLPPEVASATLPANQVPNTSVEIQAILGSSGLGVSKVEMVYDLGDGWQTMAMNALDDVTYTAMLPGQENGKKVVYYVKATNESGQVGTYPERALMDGTYLAFAWIDPDIKAMTLALDFEDGPSGSFSDTTMFDNTVVQVDTPAYSDDAAVGNYSLDCNRGFIKVNPATFQAGEQFTVDFWFKFDEENSTWTRIVSKDGQEVWHQPHFQLIVVNNKLRSRHVIDSLGALSNSELNFDPIIEIDKWYHFKFEFASDTLFGQLMDNQSQVLSESGLALATNEHALVVPSTPFHLGSSPNGKIFKGKIDNFIYHNYSLTYPPTALDDEIEQAPLIYDLAQNYPNPFNPTTTINFSLPKSEHLILKIYDVLGRQVRTLTNKEFKAGIYQVSWDGRNQQGRSVSSGVYFYQLRTKSGSFVKVRKMLMIK